MKKMFVYSIVDNVAENVVQNFLAVSDIMAERIFKNGFEKNKDLNPDDYKLFRSLNFFDYPETYAEVISSFSLEVLKGSAESVKGAAESVKKEVNKDE